MFEDISAQMREAFREEAEELLTDLDAALLELESNPRDSELINRIFRAIHTIKGSGATAGFAKLAGFTHRVEEVFEDARQGRLTVTPAITDATLKACDVIRVLIDQSEESPLPATANHVLAALEQHASSHRSGMAEKLGSAPCQSSSGSTRYRISFAPDSGIFFSGADPVTLLDELRALGRCRVTADSGSLPAFEQLNPELCYLRWNIELISEQPIEVIRNVFVFVEESDLQIEAEQCDPGMLLDNANTFPVEAIRAFFEECSLLLSSAEELLISLESGDSAPEHQTAFLSKLGGVSEAADALTSQKKKELSELHPTLQIGRLSAAAASLQPREGRFDPAQLEILFRVLECVKRQYQAFQNEEIAPVADPDVLRALGILVVEAETASTVQIKTIFAEAADQCLEAMRGALIQLTSGAGDETIGVLVRAFQTLLTIAEFHNYRAALSFVVPELELLQKHAQENELCIDAWSALIRKTEESVRGLASQPGEAPAQTDLANPAVSASNSNEKHAPAASIRVDQDKLDRLMRVVGELLVARGIFPILARRIEAETGRMTLSKEVRDAGGMISRLAEDLQDSVMSIRMLPVRTVFQKIPRLVRDLARALDKQVELSLSGEETELDKAVIEQIGDPLVHIIRNAVDHGVETPAERAEKGKSVNGHIKVSAFNQANSVVLQISDDGKGLDPAMLKRKAIEKGVITAEQAESMSNTEALDLIFAAGFSTAEKVTDVSGRGVGMDVVRNNIRNLQGTVTIQSTVGRGTVFTIKLPTSLMVSKGILISAGGQEYVFPIEHVKDLVKIKAGTVRRFRGSKLANIRGRILPVESLETLLGESSALDFRSNTDDEICVAVLSANGSDMGIVVDRFQDEVETIIKPLPAELAELSCFLGATIMGDGRIVLIVNPESLLEGGVGDTDAHLAQQKCAA